MSDMRVSDSAISREDAEEYSRSIAQIGEGWWRQIAWAFRQQIPEALGMGRKEWAESYHGYLKLPLPERREAVLELSTEGMSNVAIADTLGVDEGTVRNDLKANSEYSEPSDKDDHPHGIDEPIVDEPSEYSEPIESEDEPEAVDEETHEEPAIVVNEGDEWYTPKWLFDALDIPFSIDVCAPLDRTHSFVPADEHYTIEDDGLAQHWHGTVWCNPPYSKPEPWARRLIHHGDGLLLTHIPMNAAWAVDVWESCDAIRLFQAMEFVRPDGATQRPGYWLQLAAFGPTATDALSRIQPLGSAAHNRRRVASPMWGRVA